jgi:putative adenylate-forming enzyme
MAARRCNGCRFPKTMDPLTIAKLLRDRRALRRRDRWTRRSLEQHQATALRDLRDFAFARSPFYARLHAGLERRPLHELPVVTKAMLMERFDEVVTDRAVSLEAVRAYLERAVHDALFGDRYRVAATSGSTGLRGIFLYDADEWRAVLASYARANDWAGLRAGLTHRMRLAVVSSRVPTHQSAIVGRTLESPAVKALRLDATTPLAQIVAALNDFHPESLVGYASMIHALAREQLEGRLHIAPKAVTCASEALTAEMRRRIARAWSEPFEVYAATETAGIASDCERHRKHLYEDLVVAEVVDESHRPVPPGVFGNKLLVTVLFSRTLPLIRYELSDRVVLSTETCACGRPFGVVAAIEGRREDVLRLPGPNGERVEVHPNVVHRALEDVAASAWQVAQEQDGIHVLVAGARSELDADALARRLDTELRAAGAAPMRIVVDRVDAIPKTALGKTPLVRALP